MFFGSGRYNQNFLQNTETGLSTYEVVKIIKLFTLILCPLGVD